MKLTLQLKLVPTPEQHTALTATMRAFNAAASFAAQVAFAAQVFGQPAIHARCYRELRERFGVSAQMAVRAIGKAVETFKRDKKHCPVFRADGAMTYDHHLLGWKGPAHVSLLTLQGRQIVAMVYGAYQTGFLPRLKGQVDLVLRAGTLYLYATIDVPADTPLHPTHFLGVDLGIVAIATDSEGHRYTGAHIDVVRQRAATARRTYQATGTHAAKRRLKHMAGRQALFQRWINHGLAKRLVQYAKDTQAALVLEDLTHIRDRITVRRRQRARLHNWSFRQLRNFITYKAQRAGVPLLFVDPRNTSRTCAACAYIDKRNRRSQAVFSCLHCGHTANADHNAARNLATRGHVSAPDLCAPAGSQLAFSWQCKAAGL